MASTLRLELAKVVKPTPEEQTDERANLGYVKVVFADELRSDWLPLVSPLAGKEFGMFALPQEDTPALVAFATDDRTCGYVVGFLWSGVSKPPIADTAQQQNVWVLRTQGGQRITLDDSENPSIEVADKEGNSIKLDTKANKISLVSKGDLSIEAEGNISIGTNGKVTLRGGEIELSQ